MTELEEAKKLRKSNIQLGMDQCKAQIKKLIDNEDYQFKKIMDLHLHTMLLDYMELEKEVDAESLEEKNEKRMG